MQHPIHDSKLLFMNLQESNNRFWKELYDVFTRIFEFHFGEIRLNTSIYFVCDSVMKLDSAMWGVSDTEVVARRNRIRYWNESIEQ